VSYTRDASTFRSQGVHNGERFVLPCGLKAFSEEPHVSLALEGFKYIRSLVLYLVHCPVPHLIATAKHLEYLLRHKQSSTTNHHHQQLKPTLEPNQTTTRTQPTCSTPATTTSKPPLWHPNPPQPPRQPPPTPRAALPPRRVPKPPRAPTTSQQRPRAAPRSARPSTSSAPTRPP
jgi:hypothetical protein